MIKLTASVYQDSEKLFTGWINEIDGVIVQGESLEDIKTELFKALNIKLELLRRKHASKQSPNLRTEEYNLIPA